MAGRRAHRFGASSETAKQLQQGLETSEIAIAARIAKLPLSDDTPADKPKRKPIPGYILRVEVEFTPVTLPAPSAAASCAVWAQM